MTQAATKTSDWLDRLFASIDRKDADAFCGFLTPDARFTFGNQPAVQGRDAVCDAVGGFFSSIAGLSHRIDQVWEHSDSVVCRGEVTYTRHDGSNVTLPFADIFEKRGGLISDYRIYMDVTPLFADASDPEPVNQ